MMRRTLSILALTLLTALPVLAGDLEDGLRDAASSGDLKTVQRLITEGLPVDTPVNDYGSTVLTFAAGGGHLEIVRFLVEKGATIDVKDSFYGLTAIANAGFGGHAEVVAYLVEHGANGLGAMQSSIFSHSPEIAKAVIATGKLPAEDLDELLVLATQREAADIAALLEAAGAKLPPPSDFKLPPEALERFVGNYVLPEFGAELALTVVDGVLMVNDFASDPPDLAPLEPLAATHFRNPKSRTEYRFDEEGDKVTGIKLTPVGRDEPFQFVLKDAEAGTEAASAAEGAEAAASATADTAEAAIPPGAAGRDWPAFRGPNAAGTAQGNPPVTWNAKDGTNIRWTTAIPGRAHSSPIVFKDRLFVTSAVSSKDEGEFRHGLYGDVDEVDVDYEYSWHVFALDKATGEILWQRAAAQGVPRSAHHIKATQANASPVTDGKHLVAALGSEGLFCWDLDGNLLWKRDLGRLGVGWFYDPSIEWGHASSPIIFKDRVILQVDRGHNPFIAAYALADGRELWRTARQNLPSWGTPTLLTSGKEPEVVTNGSPFIRAYDPMTGKQRWYLGPHSEVTVGTPVVGHGMVFVTGGYPPVRPIYAVRPGGEGDISLAEDATSSEHVAWMTDRDGTYIPTPIVYGDHLYTLANSGILIVYDARTGERLYRERVAGRGGVAFTASPVAAAGRLYFTSEVGDVYVVKAGPKFERLATNAMDEIVMATPAISEDMIFIRSLEHVFAISGPTGDGTEPSR